MCILFFQLNDKPETGAYRLVLANNRDEYWARPTATAAFWGSENQNLSSLDQEPTREGGTWIGMNKQGQLGVLLNILGENLPNRKGRGFLVSDFLTSGSSAESFLQNLAVDVTTSDYNGFHLILLELGRKPPCSVVLSEKDGDSDKRKGIQTLPLSEVHAFGNSACSKPWQKVVHGKRQFKKILEEYNSIQSKSTLVEELMNLLKDKTQHMPDSVLQSTCDKLGIKQNIVQERAACCVWSPSIGYGTRTNTVILVDWDGNCDYIEQSLETNPVNVDNPQTATKTFSFKTAT